MYIGYTGKDEKNQSILTCSLDYIPRKSKSINCKTKCRYVDNCKIIYKGNRFSIYQQQPVGKYNSENSYSQYWYIKYIRNILKRNTSIHIPGKKIKHFWRTININMNTPSSWMWILKIVNTSIFPKLSLNIR